jgi:hypothetical protein
MRLETYKEMGSTFITCHSLKNQPNHEHIDWGNHRDFFIDSSGQRGSGQCDFE